MKTILRAAALALVVALSGCVVVPYGGWHPYPYPDHGGWHHRR